MASISWWSLLSLTLDSHSAFWVFTSQRHCSPVHFIYCSTKLESLGEPLTFANRTSRSSNCCRYSSSAVSGTPERRHQPGWRSRRYRLRSCCRRSRTVGSCIIAERGVTAVHSKHFTPVHNVLQKHTLSLTAIHIKGILPCNDERRTSDILPKQIVNYDNEGIKSHILT